MDSRDQGMQSFGRAANQSEGSSKSLFSSNASIIHEININIPKTSQEQRQSCDGTIEGMVRERDKLARSFKERQSIELQRSNFKWKSENEELFGGRKDPRLCELDIQSVPLAIPRIPLKSIMDVETKLVYVDEQDITFEFERSLLANSPHSVCRAGDMMDPRPQPDKWLQVSLKDASTCYRQKKYAIAAGRFRTALELCSKGAALGNPFNSSAEDISSVASFIETKLVTCYLRMRRPDLALNHAHRSITLNPVYFRNHLRQATVFRLLDRYTEAARSAMIADYMYWLSGGCDQHISKLIKLYWQAMIEEAITRAETFSVMYTPFAIKLKADKTEKVKDVFAKQHPGYVDYVYTDPQVLHILPQTTDWSSSTSQQYLLTLGFKTKEDGNFLEKISNRKQPTFIEHKIPFGPFSKEETEKHLESFGKRILPVLDFLRCTKLPGSFCACAGAVERLQYSTFLSRSQRVKEENQVVNQAMAELATIPYLQEISQQDAELLQSLMADAMDTLDGSRSGGERAWNKLLKVGLIEDFIYQLEDSFLKTKKLRTARRQRMKLKRLESVQLCQSPGNRKPSPRHTAEERKDISTAEV
ncbi:spermatogenesis-associated protein 16 [Ambystoma mexicanum]|uniref:spermatogenesis-associated protein 16 n=1 Tax=Ambystoma mexicanum TaxID=8296 RepID=UPI0037E744C8